MRKILMILLISVMAVKAQAQTAAEQLANRIAQKMKDTLLLTETQRQEIYTVNMRIASQKQAAREGSTDRNQVGKRLQQIENTRDGLYQPILGEEKFLLFKQKKRNLVNNQ